MNTILPISLTMAAAAAILNLWLSIRIGKVRISEKITVGDGGNEILTRRMRAQANFIEYTPIVLILITLLELSTGTSTWLWIVSSVFIIARIAHAIGMDGNMKARQIGMMATMPVMVGLALYAAYVAHSSGGKITDTSAEVVPAG